MKIDLIYFYRPYSSNFYLYGPQKVDNNIVVNPDGVLVFSSESAVFNKIEEMYSSLAPEITNISVKSSLEFTDGFRMRIYTGDLNAGSEFPDYTNILTSINTNLTNLNNKFVATNNSQDGSNIANVLSNIFLYNNGASCLRVNGLTTDAQKNSANLVRGLWNLMEMFYGSIAYAENPIQNKKLLEIIKNSLQQSVSPNANLTDVISSLNSNIHNDLTELNTTTNNKDNVLIVDGQQDFVIRKQNNDDYDS